MECNVHVYQFTCETKITTGLESESTEEEASPPLPSRHLPPFPTLIFPLHPPLPSSLRSRPLIAAMWSGCA